MDKKQTLNQDWLEKYAHRVIEHMNEDHQNTIVSTLNAQLKIEDPEACLLYTSPSPRDATLSRMPSSA